MKQGITISIAFIVFFVFMSCSGQATKTNDENLIGIWAGFLKDPESNSNIEPMSIEFTKDGQLIYTMGIGGMKNVIYQTYKIRGNTMIVTDNESGDIIKGDYRIEDNQLIFEYEGIENVYIKQKNDSPE